MLNTVPVRMLNDLHKRHGEAQRYYHDWSHVEALLRHMSAIGTALHDREAVLYAVMFHDSIYDPRANDNERQSAALLVESAPPLDSGSLTLARRMIEATEGHYLPEDLKGEAREDCAHFLDMDLAILGTSDSRFDAYEDQIRREYAHVPEDSFRQGRAKVLRHFAQRKQLYFSDWGRGRFEEKARANIARSLTALSG